MNGMQAVEPKEYFRDSKLQFATLSQLLITKAKPTAADMYDTVPFDIYCPSMKDKLEMEFVKNAKVTGQVKQQKIAMQNATRRTLIARRNKKVRWGKVRKMPAVMKIGTKTCLKKMIPKVVRLRDERMPVIDNIFDMLQRLFSHT